MLKKILLHVICLLPLVLMAGCDGIHCTNEIIEELVSPDGIRKMVIFSRECDATTGFNQQGTILNSDQELPEDGGSVFVMDRAEVKVSWKTNNEILVVFGHGARFFKKETSVLGVLIDYVEADSEGSQ